GIVLILVDYLMGIDLKKEAFLYLHASHWYFFLVCIIFYLICRKIRFKRYGNILLTIFSFFMAFNGSFVAGVPDTLLGRGVMAYNITLLAIAAITYIDLISSIALYIFAYSSFLSLLLVFQEDKNILAGNLINSTIITILAFLYSQVNLRNRKREINQSIIIREQSKEIENLLNNILPENIASEIRNNGKSAPKYIEDACIGFIDFVSFSKIAATVEPSYIVNKLNSFFTEFDTIIQSYGLEKLKTIGDGYMFAGGLFTEQNQEKEMVMASLDILRYIQSIEKINQEKHKWQIRIGIHSGPVVAGVIGDWRFIYDVWGDTVNVASRLESASEPNKINVSKKVYLELLKDFDFHYRGSLPVKNMEPIEMYYLINSK
ncbi:MAG: adenylate/guanylate cyclase domain-containing protein, partial [Leptospiraceae bacterium]|nr:adenylate/guanylate cyclase domain-containing protein [Leptospiraceae bacterium]